MKLLLCDNKKITTYSLTTFVENIYTIDYYNENDNYETITLKKNDEGWEINENDNFNIINKKQLYKEYDCIEIFFTSLNVNVKLYFLPDVEEYLNISLANKKILTVGCRNDNNIIFKNINTNKTFLKIEQKEDGNYEIVSLDNEIFYVNGFVENQKILKIGDIIYINGLKIIWMNPFFKISKYNSQLLFNDVFAYKMEEINTEYTKPTEFERNMTLYSDNQVFFHTPRMLSSITNEVITLDPPPEQHTNEQLPIFLSLGTSSILCLTSCLSGVNAIKNLPNQTDKVTAYIEILLSIAMLSVSILIPILTHKYQKRQEKKKKDLRISKYTEYLNSKREKINKIIKTQETILYDNNISLDDIKKRISSNTSNIWPREIADDDFLNLRLGIGNLNAHIEIEAPKEQFFLYDDKLRDNVFELSNSKKILENVPITLSLAKNKIVSFILNCSFKQNYINSLMLQIMYYYSPNDLKIIILTNKKNEEKWEYIKYLPHIWDDKRDKRFYATEENEYLAISNYLDSIFEKRITNIENNSDEKKQSDISNELYKNFDKYYLIITDNYNEIKNIPIVNRILDSNVNVGFSMLIFGDDIKNIPSKLNKFVDIKNNISGIFTKNLENSDKNQFKAEYIDNEDISSYAKIISNIPVSSKLGDFSLPSSISFLEMYHAGKISHLNIIKRWQENNPTVSLLAPIGVKENGKIIGLDLHEKVHGPHGLIAGSTGSGKSEFIITYILSMAINYSPSEVQFILIDYKGGGLAGAFENRMKGIKIPHLVGTITNLDTSEMNRTLVSIQSELKRRQAKFNEARDILGEGTIDIYKYQKMYREGKLKENISHLFVICDEFAELKQQQPDFMSELISTSRIGRSLGVHLILATQKPSGIVDDQIWSNSRFKVCLKVQTESDSYEMLKRNDASFIKETGRFYLQIGNNESFEYAQSAWSGAKYTPVDHLRKKIDDSIDYISNDGEILRSINTDVKYNKDDNNYGEQLTNIVNYLYDIAVKENIPFSSLWLPSLSKTIYFDNLVKKYNFKNNNSGYYAIIGEYDKPEKQKQGIYLLDLNNKNTIVFGIPNSGKENYLYDVIYSLSLLYTPQSINIYILDFGSESLSMFSKYPQVGDYITVSSKEKVIAEFEYLEKEMKKRKELFAEYGGSFDNYCKNSNQKIPLIVTILNSYESYLDNCYDYDDAFNRLLREGSKYGIIFIATCVSSSSVRPMILEYFSNKVMLQSNEDFDYRFVLGAPIGMVPAKNYGRGLTYYEDDVCEFQSALISDDDKLLERVKYIEKYLNDRYKYRVPSIKILPNKILLNSMFKYAKQINRIPLGYTRDNVDLCFYDFVNKKVTNIIGNNVTNDVRFMCSIIDLIDSVKNIKLNIFDFITCVKTDGNADYYSVSFIDAFNKILKNNSEELTINIIIGIGNISEVFDENEKVAFDTILNNINNLKNQVFIIFDNNDRFSKITNKIWYNNINKNYIWVGKYIDSQDIFDISKMSNYDINEKMDDVVYIIEENNYCVIKGISGSE